jgi:hypothetical protein
VHKICNKICHIFLLRKCQSGGGLGQMLDDTDILFCHWHEDWKQLNALQSQTDKRLWKHV